MSAFGDNNFKSSIYENLNWMVNENPIEQLNWLHYNSIELLENGTEYINDYIKMYANDWDLTVDEIKEGLSEVYSYILAYSL